MKPIPAPFVEDLMIFSSFGSFDPQDCSWDDPGDHPDDTLRCSRVHHLRQDKPGGKLGSRI